MPLASGPSPLTRFSDRVENYVRYRPDYPAALLDFLEAELELRPGARVADLGSGTGIFTSQLLERGAIVHAVEPNPEMRAAAERILAGKAGFLSVAAPAEATRLEPGSIDLVTAAQAFHWFEPSRARAEMDRILKPSGHIALIWNDRLLEGSPFLEEYERFLLEHGTDYAQVRHQNLQESGATELFFAPSKPGIFECPHFQRFDFEGLAGRLLSSSYAPAPGHPKHAPMIKALRALFDRHQESGTVTFEYRTRAYYR